MKFLQLFLFVFNFYFIYGQSIPKEFSGVVKINDSLFIPYNLSLNRINDTEILGYSITDKGGVHETKSNVTGYFDEEKGVLKFNEFDIVYTKSPYDQFDFCFVHFEGSMKKFKSAKALKGAFFGKYVNGAKCIDGELLLVDEQKIEKIKKRFDKPKVRKLLEKSKKIDTVSLAPITKNETVNVFVKSSILMVSIYDSGKEDNDQIDLYLDDKLILNDYVITREKKQIPIQITQKFARLKVVALNEGTSPPNTVKIEVHSPNDYISTKTSLNKGEMAVLSFVKKGKRANK
ncbi:hypothetical protein [Aquimarina agarilytica]|uniref:hypothetical protein n=1 Tax=Aquimarina agarilytica TaxID=1087449 RepID=UPI0002882DEE|nr:hypothetical protein [Aquimarina agarilytica]